MSEVAGLQGQIMHTPTAEKIIQPVEAKAEVADQAAALAAEQRLEEKRQAVQETPESQGGRVEEDKPDRRDRRGRKSRPKAKPRTEQEEEVRARKAEGRLIDLRI